MSDIRRLYQESGSYLLGMAGTTLLGFVSFPLFTRILPVNEYGLLNLVLRTLAMAVVVSKLGLQHSVVRFFEEHRTSPDPNALSRYYSVVCFGSTGLAIAFTTVLAATVWAAPGGWISETVRRPLLAASALVFTGTVISQLMGFLRVTGRVRAFALFQVATKAATIVVVTILFFQWERTARAFVVGTVLVEAGGVLFLTVPLLRGGYLRIGSFDAGLFRGMLAFGVPLFVFELSSVLHESLGRFLIQAYLGSVQLGYYSAAHNVASYCQELLLTPLNLALVPMFVRIWTTQGRTATQAFLSRVLNDVLFGAFVVTAGVVVCARDAMLILASRKYEQSAALVPVLVAGLMLNVVVSIFYAGIYLEKRTWTMARLVISASLVNVALNLLLLPRLGISGAVYATLGSYSVLLLMTAGACRRALPLDIPWTACGGYLIAAAAGAAAAWPIRFQYPALNLTVRGAIVVVVYGAVVWLINPRVRELFRAFVKQALAMLAR